jgi:hypothetical protein
MVDPNFETSDARALELEQLVSAHDTAIFGVAAGTGLRDRDVPEVQALARPVSNTRKPKHVGQYIRATSDEDLLKAFDDIFDRIAKCS